MRLLILVLSLHQCLATNLLLEGTVKAAVTIVDLISDTFLAPPPLPVFNESIWWGEGDSGVEDTSITPYTIQFNSERIKRLISKLGDRENFTQPLAEASFAYGVNSSYLNTLLDYWQTQYNFTARQARLNTFPQYMTNVQGLDIHYYHIKPNTTKKVVPLLILHGWPLSNTEYFYLFSELTKEREGYDYVFEVIAPSVPGYGYSTGTNKIGFGSYQVAIVLKRFMNRIGFKKFYVQGGDIGIAIAADLATIYEDDILGIHTNLPYNIRLKTGVKYLLGALYPQAVVEEEYADRMYPIPNVLYFLVRFFGYFHMHATKPDTIGIALEDSPSGLASWILGMMSWMSNPANDHAPDGGLLKAYKIDDLMDLLTIWWDSNSMTTAVRFYAESLALVQDPNILLINFRPTMVPYSVLKLRHEVFYQPDGFLKDRYPNLVHSTTLDYGGHYAALENYDVLEDNIFEGVQKMIEFNEAHGRS